MLSKSAGHLFIIAAPSGTGKTSLVAALLQQIDNLRVSISHTTRGMRSGEVDEKDYFFVTKEAFIEKIAEKAFLEYAMVFDHYYGTARTWVEEQLATGVDVILEIDWQGARQIKLSYPEAISIFILPPSLTTLRNRLEQRGQDSLDTIAKRLSKAQEEIKHHIEYDYLVVNDDFIQAAEELRMIIIAQRLRTTSQTSRHAKLLENLLENLSLAETS